MKLSAWNNKRRRCLPLLCWQRRASKRKREIAWVTITSLLFIGLFCWCGFLNCWVEKRFNLIKEFWMITVAQILNTLTYTHTHTHSSTGARTNREGVQKTCWRVLNCNMTPRIMNHMYFLLSLCILLPCISKKIR